MQESALYNYKIFDFSFSLASDSADALRLFDLVYKNFRQKNGKTSAPTFEVVIQTKEGEAPYFKSEGRVYPFHSFSPVESQVFKLVTDELYRRVESHFLIHGGGVCFQNKGVIVSGESGTGKTSLIVNLLTRGFQFLSDEVVPINRKTGMMEPFPRAVGLRTEARFLLKEGFDLFGKEKFNDSSGHKYFVNPSFLSPEKIGGPSLPLYFLYLAKPKSSPECKTIIHMVIESRGKEFISLLKRIKGLRILQSIQRKNDMYLKIEIPRKAAVMKEYLEGHEKFKRYIIHSERKKEEGITFDQKPRMTPLHLHDMSLLLMKQLKDEIIEHKLRGEKFKSVGSFWLYLVEALGLDRVKGYKIHVGRFEETTQLIQELVR